MSHFEVFCCELETFCCAEAANQQLNAESFESKTRFEIHNKRPSQPSLTNSPKRRHSYYLEKNPRVLVLLNNPLEVRGLGGRVVNARHSRGGGCGFESRLVHLILLKNSLPHPQWIIVTNHIVRCWCGLDRFQARGLWVINAFSTL